MEDQKEDMPTTTQLTEKFINEHQSVKYCLKKGLLNYSALARLIAKELKIEKKTSKEAILIAARRYKEKIKDQHGEKEVIALFKQSNVEIKNNIVSITIEKNVYPDSLVEMEKEIKKQKGLFFAIEGTRSITLIFQKKYKSNIEKKFKNNLLEKKDDLSLITINSEGIGDIPGAVSYVASLFFEQGINIEEFMSCYDDTLIVIDSKDIEKVMKFLHF